MTNNANELCGLTGCIFTFFGEEPLSVCRMSYLCIERQEFLGYTWMLGLCQIVICTDFGPFQELSFPFLMVSFGGIQLLIVMKSLA